MEIENGILHVGFKSYAIEDEIELITGLFDSINIKRKISSANEISKFVDASKNKKTRAVVFLTSGRVYKTFRSTDVLLKRVNNAINFINIGNDSFIPKSKIEAITGLVNIISVRNIRSKAEKEGRLMDCTKGKETKSVIITKTNFVHLSYVTAETIAKRYIKEEA
ncbi:MAG: extracellular matrix/biofilm biosynthesis regulator RemA family protein [bacterium]